MNNITVEELKARMDAGETLNIIDVREPAEYTEYNIGATLFPLGKIVSMQLEDLEDLKNEELIIHCKAGTRSLQACVVLEQVGFTNVVNLVGGITSWKKKFG
jgi:rhodanese-related sulfurtransferase